MPPFRNAASLSQLEVLMDRIFDLIGPFESWPAPDSNFDQRDSVGKPTRGLRRVVRVVLQPT